MFNWIIIWCWSEDYYEFLEYINEPGSSTDGCLEYYEYQYPTDYYGDVWYPTYDYDGNATEAGEIISEGSGVSESTIEDVESKIT